MVEDDCTVAEVVVEFLARVGYSTHVAHDTDTALNFLNQYSYKLLIVDGQLPGKEGPWLVKKVKREHPHLPVLGISGNGYGQSFYLAGAEAFLPKPFTFQQLKRKISSLLPLLL